MTLTRNHYITYLEKRAAESALAPNYHVDNAEVARKEHVSNKADTRTSLKGLFDNAGSVESGNTKTMDTLLPSKSGEDRETSNPLLKVAFYVRVGEELPKIASDMRRRSFQSCIWELQKIASQVSGMLRALGKGAPGAAAGVAKATSPQVANQGLKGFQSIARNPTAMPSFPGLSR